MGDHDETPHNRIAERARDRRALFGSLAEWVFAKHWEKPEEKEEILRSEPTQRWQHLPGKLMGGRPFPRQISH